MSLANAVRPTRFSELIGQEAVTQNILTQVVKKPIRQAWLFHGENGSGKTTLARIMAVSFQLPSTKNFGEPTREQYNEPWDIHDVNASSLNTKEDVAALVEQASYAPTLGKKKVFILDEAHKITEAAQNLLLKHLEDPPSTVVWIICTTAVHKILRGIRQRCLSYRMCPIMEENVSALVDRAGAAAKLDPKTADKLKKALNERMVTSGRAIVNAVELLSGGGTLKTVFETGSLEVDGLAVCRAVVGGDFRAVTRLLKDGGPDDIKTARLAILGYLKTMLVGTPQLHVASAIETMGEVLPWEDPAAVAVIWARLYRVCRTFEKARG